jgi:hypothetical protein
MPYHGSSVDGPETGGAVSFSVSHPWASSGESGTAAGASLAERLEPPGSTFGVRSGGVSRGGGDTSFTIVEIGAIGRGLNDGIAGLRTANPIITWRAREAGRDHRKPGLASIDSANSLLSAIVFALFKRYPVLKILGNFTDD